MMLSEFSQRLDEIDRHYKAEKSSGGNTTVKYGREPIATVMESAAYLVNTTNKINEFPKAKLVFQAIAEYAGTPPSHREHDRYTLLLSPSPVKQSVRITTEGLVVVNGDDDGNSYSQFQIDWAMKTLNSPIDLNKIKRKVSDPL